MNASTRPVILQVRHLHFAYPGQPALACDWSASLPAGVTQIHGDTGSGKSTLLRLMAGALPATGQLTLAGARLDDDPEAYRRHVFFCEPSTDAFDQVTARACTESLCAGDARFNAAAWRALVEGFALTAHLDKPLHMLSTGSKRKVLLAAALASGRALVLLDEPTGGLDAASIGCLWNSLAGIAKRPDQAVVVASAQRFERVTFASSIRLPLG